MKYTEEGSEELVLNRFLSKGSRTQLHGERGNIIKALIAFSKGYSKELTDPRDAEIKSLQEAGNNLAAHVEKYLRPDLAGSKGKEVLMFIQDLRELTGEVEKSSE